MAKTLFDKFGKTIATHEQLETMDRDLSFHPATSAAATTLSAAQVEAFNRTEAQDRQDNRVVQPCAASI